MRLKEGCSYKERVEGDTACGFEDVRVRLSLVVWAEAGEKERGYIQIGGGSRSGAAFIVVEVVACRRVSQRSDIRQRSSESRLEIEIEAGHNQ